MFHLNRHEGHGRTWAGWRQTSAPAAAPSAAAVAGRAVVSLLTSVCLTLGPGAPAQALQLASVAEDALLQVVRVMEVGADSALGALRDAAATQAPPPSDDVRQQAAALVQEVWETVDSNFLDARGAGFNHASWNAFRDETLAHPPRDLPAARTMARKLVSRLRDPYSRFLDVSEFGAMAKYDVSGVGLNLGTADELERKTTLAIPDGRAPEGGGIWVVGLIRGLPAAAAGIEQGDQLLELEGLGLAERTPFEVASLLAGQDGALPGVFGWENAAPPPPLTLKVRKLSGAEAMLSLPRPTRAPQPSPVSSTAAHGGGDAVIRLRSFTARAQRDVAEALRELGLDDASSGSGNGNESGGGRGGRRLVLDLRGNRGGLVSEGAEVARLFLGGEAPVVRTMGRAATAPAPRAAGVQPAVSSAPLAVLVDGHTASAAEIAAGALRDNCRAVLVGPGRTYGKGLIQSVYELSDGSGLVLTVGKYLTPAGTDIDRQGLVPDFASLPTPRQAAATLDACRLQLPSTGGSEGS